MNGNGEILKQRLYGGKDKCESAPPRRHRMWFGLINSRETFGVKSLKKAGWYKHKKVINDSIVLSGILELIGNVICKET